MRNLRALLKQNGQRTLAAGEADDHVVELVSEVDDLIAREPRSVADVLKRVSRGIEAILRELVRRRLFTCRDRPGLEQRICFADLGIELRLGGAKRIDLRPQCLGARFEVFSRPRGFLEYFCGIAGRAGARRPNPHEGIELTLRIVGACRLPGGLRQALKPLRFAIGRRSRGVDRRGGAIESVLTCLSDLVEGALDVILSGDADADRDVVVGQGSVSLA